jgi:uncharacterized protein YpmS
MQQINFYLPEFQPNREPFRSSQLVFVLIIVMLLLAIFTFKSNSNNNELQKKLEQDSLQVNGIKSQLQQFANSKIQVNIVELDNRIIQIKNEIARRQQLLQVISYQRLGNDKGFSAQLEAMARQSNPQIALEIFSLKHGGNYLEMVGNTTSADKLPAYIGLLKLETVFSDVSFGVLEIKPDTKFSGQLRFVVAEPEQDSRIDDISAVQTYVKETGNKGRSSP